MKDNHYSIYSEQVLQLAESIAIKSDDTVHAINRELLIRLGPTAVDEFDKTTWKYYLHLSGEYHFDDEVMQVISMDTLETINFTRDNLQFHRSTARAYVFGSKYFKELVNRYPNQKRLILGILYPCDIEKAIESRDGTILSYPPHLVEDYEYSLIDNLQTWIYKYLDRWDNKQFRLSDNLYSTTVLGIMYLNLVPAIFNIRQKACKTNEVHSFHLRQYLSSNGLLDQYIPYLTRSQALFLYRNINYIKRNTGKQSVFEWLTEHIMTRRGLPLAAYEMRHDLTDQPANLKPLISFEKQPLNTEYNYDMKDRFTLPQVFDKEDPLARDNVKYRDIEQAKAVRSMEYSLSNQLKTKLLESSIIDYSGSEKYTLADTLINHWAMLSNSKWMYQGENSSILYKAFVNVESPVTGETLVLSAQDAFTFYVYASCYSIGITLETLPEIIAERVMLVTKPSMAQLMSMVNPKVVSEEFAQQMLDLMPEPDILISTDSFYEYCVQLQQAAMQQYFHVSAEQLNNARGQKAGLVARLWSDTGIKLWEEYGEPISYAQWFSEKNIVIDSYTREHLIQITADLLEAATGISTSKAITMEDIQRAMIRLMTQLSSYSVQYSSTINSGPVLDAGDPGIRPDDITGKNYYHKKIIMVVGTIATKFQQKFKLNLDIGSKIFKEKLNVYRFFDEHFEITIKPKLADNGIEYFKNIALNTNVGYELPELPDNPRGVTNVIGIDHYLSLPIEDQMTVPDLWFEE